MMNREDDFKDLTRVGPGTVMGEFIRQYWIPVAKSSEIATGEAPVRLLILCEKLVAFRDQSGALGILDHQCPHRCASLALARSEEGGVRCIYHGWKFDVRGRCTEMPNVPPTQDFKHKVQAKSYRAAERNGIVWAYMGPRQDEPPPLPMLEATLVPEGELGLAIEMRNCNWLQALEGDIDTSHFGFLHAGHLDAANVPDGHPLEHTTSDVASEFVVHAKEWGSSYGAFKKIDREANYWRVANFLFPFWTQTPQGEFASNIQARAWVPIDDTHTLVFFWRKKRAGKKNTSTPLKDGHPLAGIVYAPKFLPRHSGWLGRYRLARSEEDDWGMDREAQRTNGIYSGLPSIDAQDQAVTESMGPMTDHTKEHLGPADVMIIRTRRRLLDAARRTFQSGLTAPCVDDPVMTFAARSGYFQARSELSLEEACRLQLELTEKAV